MDSNLSNSSQRGKQSEVFKPVNHSIIGSDDKFKLFCWVLHECNGAFSVNIWKSETVADLKTMIQTLIGISPDILHIWKVRPPGMCRLGDLTFG
jgi:hypothetical protein